jgi:hypothetical protein
VTAAAEPTAPEATPADPNPATPPETPPAQPPAAPEGTKRSLEDSLAALDDETKAYVLGEVTKARTEARKLRDRVKDADPAKVKTELLAEIAKAMGVSGDQPPDPATLTQQLADQTSAAREARVSLAVYRLAAAGGGNPAAVLDSLAFRQSVAAVDPGDVDAVTAAIKAAVTANPALAAIPARGVPAPNPALGSSASGAPDLEAQIAAAQKAGDIRAVIALQNQKLTAPTQPTR